MRVKIMQIRTWAIAATALGLAPVGNLAAHAQEGSRPEVAHKAARALVGNTLVYAKPGQPGAEIGVFLYPDGTGRAITRGPDGTSEPRAIRWANLSDGKFCITDLGRQPWDGDCGILSVDGASATLAPPSGPEWSGRVLEGDAWRLDPATLSGERLTGRAAIDALVGNTLVFIPEGGGREYRAHYFMPGGTARRAHNDQPYFDHWVLQADEKWSIRGRDDQLCLSGGQWKGSFCAAVAIAGDLVTLRDDRIGPLHARFLKGDARHLSPAAGAETRKMADALIGNTMLLKAADRQAETDSVVYFLRDGSGLAKWGDGAPMSIKWLVQTDGKLCVAEQRRDFRDQDCASLSIDGDAVTLAAPDRPSIPGQLLKGNALKP